MGTIHKHDLTRDKHWQLPGGDMCKKEVCDVVYKITVLMGSHDKIVAEAEKSLNDLKAINKLLAQALNQLLEIGIEKQEGVQVKTTR